MTIVNLTAVKSVNCGGRLYTGIDTVNTHKNGAISFLGDYAGTAEGLKEGQTQVRKFELPKETTGVNKYRMPVIIMQPEMMYDNSRMSKMKLENFDIPAGELFTCVPLELGDKFEVTKDIFRKANVSDPVEERDLAVGKCYVLDSDVTYLRLSADGGVPRASRIYFQIVKIKDAHSRSARIGGEFVDDNYKLYTVEVRKK